MGRGTPNKKAVLCVLRVLCGSSGLVALVSRHALTCGLGHVSAGTARGGPRPATRGSGTVCPVALSAVAGTFWTSPVKGETVTRAEALRGGGPGPSSRSMAPSGGTDRIGRGYGQPEVESCGERQARGSRRA